MTGLPGFAAWGLAGLLVSFLISCRIMEQKEF